MPFSLSLLLLVALIAVAGGAAQNLAADCAVLEQFFTSNSRNFNWTEGQCCGSSTKYSWYTGGSKELSAYATIACESDRVTTVSFPSQNFRAPFPDISTLTALRWLDLSGNYWNMSVPALSKLAALEFVDISYCLLLQSSIPDLAGLSNLQTFRIFASNFSGTIPSLEGLTTLSEFNVSENKLSGDVPSSLASLTNLARLGLDNNAFTSLPPLSGLPKLERMDVSWNSLQASPALSNLPVLQYLNLGRNSLTSWPILVDLPSLATLDMSSNRLKGQLPNLSQYKNLTYLDVSDNELEGNIDGLLPSGLTTCVLTYNTSNPCLYSTTGNYPKACSATWQHRAQNISTSSQCVNGVPKYTTAASPAIATTSAATNTAAATGTNSNPQVTNGGFDSFAGFLIAGVVLAAIGLVGGGITFYMIHRRSIVMEHVVVAKSQEKEEGDIELHTPWEAAVSPEPSSPKST
ncbi:L domain-like protein [Gonapodya prolifera JEL478]|uniref:L domain-like protein n=1 Tax=Gonapodya prolifera (strain JEL478) TaxID=1344416 RepID=A0A139APN3_GONPJ|nr:L domain-like protein [Gonapodya prolifera JEL478]|eukprot:KXS18709.1 L domain-like protein [Gonapodya prolifera JEL478]